MIEFLQVYGSWILIGLFFLAMMRMHGSHGGMGCGMGGGHQHQPSHDQEENSSDDAPTKSTGCH